MSRPCNGIKMFFDGASKSNPGPSGAAYWVECEDMDIDIDAKSSYKFFKYATNNEAEYNGLILGLKSLLKYRTCTLTVYGDSKLVIEQMKGNYKVKAQNLKPLWQEAQDLAKQFTNITFIHIDRSLNTKADNLANIAVSKSQEG